MRINCLLRSFGFALQLSFKKATKENSAAVEASYVVSKMTAKVGKRLTEGEFVKKCLFQAASIVCPGKASLAPSVFLPTL